MALGIILKKITDRYDPEFDTTPDGPPVTWAEMDLAFVVSMLLDRIEALEAQVAALQVNNRRLSVTRKETMNDCPHKHIVSYNRLVYPATLYDPAEYIERGICADCGDALDPSDIPDDAEITEGDIEPPMRGRRSEFYN